MLAQICEILYNNQVGHKEGQQKQIFGPMYQYPRKLKSRSRMLSYNGTAPAPSNFMFSKAVIAAWLFGILFLISALALVWMYRQQQDLKLQNYNLSEEKKLNQEKKEINSEEDLLARLAQIMIMPEDKPVIYTVKGVETLSQTKPFYKNSKNGDRILLYKNRAILYRPSEDKIVNFASSDNLITDLAMPFSGTTTSTTTTTDLVSPSSATPTNTAVAVVQNLEIRNGTPTAGLASKWRSTMTDKGYKVLTIGNAANDQYAETTIINVSGKDVSKLEQDLGVVAVTNLPISEASTQADALIILGTK